MEYIQIIALYLVLYHITHNLHFSVSSIHLFQIFRWQVILIGWKGCYACSRVEQKNISGSDKINVIWLQLDTCEHFTLVPI